MLSCINKNLKCAEILLRHKAGPNTQDKKSGRTSLFHAAENHHRKPHQQPPPNLQLIMINRFSWDGVPAAGLGRRHQDPQLLRHQHPRRHVRDGGHTPGHTPADLGQETETRPGRQQQEVGRRGRRAPAQAVQVREDVPEGGEAVGQAERSLVDAPAGATITTAPGRLSTLIEWIGNGTKGEMVRQRDDTILEMI